MRLWTLLFLVGATFQFLYVGSLVSRSQPFVAGASSKGAYAITSENRPQHRGSGRKDAHQPLNLCLV
jgi:hypothetical protein